MKLPVAAEMTARRTVGRLFGSVLRRGRGFASKRASLLQRLATRSLVDIGANIGQYGSQVRLYGYTGALHSFEPLASAYRDLSSRAGADGNWRARHLGLGRTAGTATLHVAANSQSSSLLSMLPRHLETAPESAYVDQQTVELTTLRTVLDELGPSFVKIDAQGSERAILEGGGDLARVQGLELELSLVPLYAGETLFPDMVAWLGERGFALHAIGDGIRDPRTGAVLQVDALFTPR